MQINICFGINNSFCQHCACTIASILYNSNPEDTYTFYIISNYISEQNKMMIKSLRHIKNFKIKFLIADMSEYKYLWQNNDLGMSTFFRFKAFEWLKLDKVLYLDADIIVRDDIGILYRVDITDYYGAGVEDIISPAKIKELGLSDKATYVNAGVLLINLKKCREEKMVEKLLEVMKNPWEKATNDQEIINILWDGRIKIVDLIWNCMYSYKNCYQDQNYYHSMAQNPAIMHYITANKPWVAGSDPHLKYEYFKYLKLTPYYYEFMLQYNMEENGIILKKLDEINQKLSS